MQTDALQAVLALFREPGRVADFRDRPLPEDTGQIIRIAAGESAAIENAVELTDERAETLIDACIFYLQQMLFGTNADSYRVLGLSRDAPQEQLREHYRWLMRWLHPDRNPDGWEVVYADRVNAAWQDLKTAERRADYDSRVVGGNMLPTVTGAPAVAMRVRTSVADDGRPLLSGTTVRRLPAIIFGILSLSAITIVGLMYWAQNESLRRDERIAGDTEAPPPDGPASVFGATAPAEFVSTSTDTESDSVPDERFVSEQLHPQELATDPNAAGHLASEQAAKLAAQQLVAEQLAAEHLRSEQLAAEQSSVEQLAAEKVEEKRLASEQLAADKLAIEKLADEKLASEKLVAEKLAGEKLAAEKLAAEKLAAEKLSAQKVALERVSEKVSAEKVAAEKLAVEKVAAEKVAAQKVAAENVVAERLAAERRVAQKIAADKIAAEKIAAEKIAAEKVAVEKIAAEKLAAQQAAATPLDATAAIAQTPERNEAQFLMGEVASAYSSGNVARFDKLFVAGAGAESAANGLRNRMQSTQMRYLEVGKADWNMTADSAVGRISYRDTFVPSGGKKAITLAGQMRLTVRMESGRARIYSFEVADLANN